MGNLRITIRSSPTEERTVEVPIPSSRHLGGNTEVREFLAKRARERRSAARARRIRRTCLALGAATAVAAFVVPKFRARWRSAEAATVSAPVEPAVAMAAPPAAPGFAVTPAKELELATAAPAAEPEVTPAPAAEPVVTAAPPIETVVAAAPPTETAAPATEVTAAPAPAEPVTLAAVAPAKPASIHPGFRAEPPPADPSKCLEDFDQQRWRAAVENCTLAFETASDASLALKVAHAHWARGDVRLSGEWAEKALELGSEDADAYVLIGHARRRAGHADEAIAAYRQYLRASPQGWHARKVRSALRRLRPTAAAEAEVAPAPETEAAVPQAAADVEPAAQTLQ